MSGLWVMDLTNMDKGLPWHVGKGLVITEDQAEWFLYQSLMHNYFPDVLRALTGGNYSHPQGAVDGGLDFHFNCGGILKASWPRLLGAGNLAAAKTSMESWNKAGGRVLADLVRRRARNWAEVSEGVYGHMTGPLVVEPNAANRETYHGTGDLLTAYPTPPGSVAPLPKPSVSAPTPALPGPGALREGDSGAKVTETQMKLNDAGIKTPISGVFDATMKDAVYRFQDAHPNLTSDGVVGPATDAALDRAKNLQADAAMFAKAAPLSGGGVYVMAHEWVSAHAGNVALMAIILAVIGVTAYIGYQYRHDIMAKINKWTGRVVA